MIQRYAAIALGAAAWLAPLLAPTPARAQLWTWTAAQLTEYTSAWKGERLPDGRPKVSDALLERARGLAMEEITVGGNAWGVQQQAQGGRGGAAGRGAPGVGGGGYSQYVGDWKVLRPGKKMVGRVVTMVFMPSRPDLDSVVAAKAKAAGIQNLNAQYVLDKLQPGDVLVVDLMGKAEGGAIVDDKLFAHIQSATKNGGLVVDGALRNLESIAKMEMPAYYRGVHPTALAGVSLAGYNVPIRIGNVTVMPGDVAVGDREGVSFVPPQALEGILRTADTTHIHDEWTRMKFDEGKYKSSEIYSSPRDPKLREEYNAYLKKKLAELEAQRAK